MHLKNKVSLIWERYDVLLIFVIVFLVYLVSSAGSTPYDYFTRLSEQFMRGRYWLTDNPLWLNELIPATEGKYYVAYPPMPAILAVPFVFVFGKGFEQQILAHLVGSGIVVVTYKLAVELSNRKIALWTAMLVGFGSIVWFLSSSGSSWYLGQLSAALFLTLALWAGLGKRRALLVGIFLGAAYLSRLHTILSLPVFLYLFRKSKREWTSIFLGLLPFFIFNGWYNFVRFGTLWDRGYLLIPGVLEESWYNLGLFHPSYIGRHLKAMFASMPIVENNFPYLIPSWGGLAIWITTPAFIYVFLAPLGKHIVKVLWLGVLLVSIPIITHGTTGFTQFGYRFAVDFYPLLSVLVVMGIRKKISWHHWALLILGIIVNLWGVLWINKFGWVSF